MSPDVNDPGYRAVTFDDLRIAYKQQVEALIDGGSDIIGRNYFRYTKCQSGTFAIEEVKTNAILIFQSWFQERLPMLQEEHFQGKR
jgi:methionine synthase I (cobalamin-dependent)